MERTKAIAIAIRDDLKTEFNKHWYMVSKHYSSLVDRCAVALMHWMITRRSVQHLVSDQFADGTPMCKLLRDAISDQLDHYAPDNISADDIRNLDDYIERAVDEQIGRIGDERWFTDAVNGAIDTEQVAESVSRHVIENHTDMLVDLVLEVLKERAKAQ